MQATAILASVAPEPATPAAVRAEFRARLSAGARLVPSGHARDDPRVLLQPRWLPRFAVRLFDAVYYLTEKRRDADIDFMIGYVAFDDSRRAQRIHPRIFYKDPSLVWRVGSHVILSDQGNWIGKGAVRRARVDGAWCMASAEETTNLPFEVQAAFDEVSRRTKRPRWDRQAVPMLLRAAREGRIEPFADFEGPRRKHRAERAIHGGRRIAQFTRPGDPRSLVVASGYEPDFAGGRLDVSRSASLLYGGDIEKHRILSRNRRIQWQFVAGPRHVWANPPQALTTHLSSFGVRTADVLADEELCVPGFDYHYLDEYADPPTWHSQIPAGYAGAASELDPARADASAWLDQVPLLRQFRRAVLGRG